MNHIQNILKIGGSLGSLAFASSIDPTGGFICKAIEAVSGNLLSNFVNKYDPATLLEYLKKSSELNHDIEKLMVDSVQKAVELVTVKYYQENPYDDKFIKETFKRLIDDAKIMPKDSHDVLMVHEKDAWLEGIHKYIFRGQPDQDGKLNEIEAFFIENLKTCYELVFNEGLKDEKNERPLKAFLIKSLSGLTEQADKNSETQQKILDEIQLLKENNPANSLSIAQGYFEAQFSKFDNKLVELLVIAKRTEGKIDLIYQYFGIIVQKIDNLQTGQDRIEKKLDQALENQNPTFPHHLTLPPLVPEVFEGRTDELQNIKKALFEDENLLLLVNGEGGIGKTSLAAKYYQQYAFAYKHLAWVLCEQSIADALLTLALPLKLRFDDTTTTDQHLTVLLQQMVNLDKPCLLIIDNANEVADLDKNYRLLRQCPNFHILLTSRINAYKNAKFLKIDSLPAEQALAVFREHYPKLQSHEEPIFEGIYTAVGGNTLVLELLAKNVALQNSLKTKYSLASLLADLQTKGLLQIVEDDAVNVEYQSYQTAKPTEVIAAMYDLGKLSEAECRLLSVFAVLPAENIVYKTLEALLPQTLSLDKTLLSLAQKGWLNHNTTDISFKCSPIIQEITQAKNQNLYADCEEMILVLIDKLEYDSGCNLMNVVYQEGVLYVRFSESLIANLDEIEYNLALLCERIGNFHKTHGNNEKGIMYAEKNSDISKNLVEQFPENEYFKHYLAISYQFLGNLQQSLGNLGKALEYFEQFNLLENELYKDYPSEVDVKNGLAVSYQFLGNLQITLGNLGKALEYFEQFNQLEIELQQDYPNRLEFKNLLAISYQLLGRLQLTLGNLDKALEYFEQFNKLAKELHRNYPNQISFKNILAISFQCLAILQQSLGNLDYALEYFEQYHLFENELYRDYPNQAEFKNNLAISYQYLGFLQQSLGNLDKALDYYEQYNLLANELHQDYPNQVEFKNLLAISYQCLGFSQHILGDFDKALEYYEQYNLLENELSRDYPNQVEFKNLLAISYSRLGIFHEDKNQKQKAKVYFLQCEKLWQELVNDFPMYAEFKKNLNWVKNALAGLGG